MKTSADGSALDIKGSFRNLIVWQRAIELSVAVYQMTADFPPSEKFGLVNQMRRAAVSVASNIAEGYGRSTKGEYILFLGHARGSNCEVQTQLEISDWLGLATAERRQKVAAIADEVGKMLVSLMKKLRS